jgi:PncC family amidohydrolase
LARRVVEGAGTRTIAVAESCTGGGVGAALTSVPGSSAVFLGGVVAYADRVKERLLGVAAPTLASSGAVSRETAEAMAEGALRLLGAHASVAVTGVAGPGGASPGKPVGTVWVAAVAGEVRKSRLLALPGDRAAVRAAAVEGALSLLAELLEGGGAKGDGRAP